MRPRMHPPHPPSPHRSLPKRCEAPCAPTHVPVYVVTDQLAHQCSQRIELASHLCVGSTHQEDQSQNHKELRCRRCFLATQPYSQSVPWVTSTSHGRDGQLLLWSAPPCLCRDIHRDQFQE